MRCGRRPTTRCRSVAVGSCTQRSLPTPSRAVGLAEAELAFHYEQAGMPAEAYAVASVAGREAKESGAITEAVALLERQSARSRRGPTDGR
jgi:hypothetical protein